MGLSQPLPIEHTQGVAPSLTDPRRSRIGILVPNFSSRAITADSSWCACFPKSCNPPSKSLGTAGQEPLQGTKEARLNTNKPSPLSLAPNAVNPVIKEII